MEKQIYEIRNEGCDATTEFELELGIGDFTFLQYFAAMNNEAAKGAQCMPIISISEKKPA